MPAKIAAIGRSFHDHCGRRTSGHRTKHAKPARQNASAGPGQPLRYGAFTKKPLVLHIVAAASTNNRAWAKGGPSTPAAASTGSSGGRAISASRGSFMDAFWETL